MAEQTIQPTVQFLLQNLSSLIQREIGLMMGVGNEMKKLFSTLTTIQTVLQDAEEKQFDDEVIRDWLRKLYDLTCEIEDILDECTVKLRKDKIKIYKQPIRCLSNIPFRSKIARRMQEVTRRLDESVAQKQQYLNLREGVIEDQIYQVAFGRATTPVLNVSHPVYGRDEDKEKIVHILVNEMRDCTELSVLPIIGMGGLGKTTLAQLVFNDQRVADHFETKLWVCVSDDFDHKTLIKAILKSMPENKSIDFDSFEMEYLQTLLSDLLSNKRYFLVLDDVWSEDQQKWDVLKSSLACGSSGASIVVTTRLRTVADVMSTLPVHQLTELSEGDCWFLFKKRAFGDREEVHPNLETVGKEIVKKCFGVPLAAKTLGGLLRHERTERKWNNIKDSSFWNLPQTENSIMPALRLSYKNLHPTLKQCFVVCAVFPKDSYISKKELILMWIAHGYIPSSRTMEVEDIGDDIWNELALRGLFHDITTELFDGIDEIYFKMHDLVHDLAQSIMESKVVGSQMEINNTSAPNTRLVRQVNLSDKSVAFPTNILPTMDLTSALKEFHSLRILNASNIGLQVLPSAIGRQKHLRSLNLSNAKIQSLPNDICKLWNLKVLNLTGCNKLMSLPKKMKKLINLRHLILEMCDSLSEMPPSIGELASLQTLSKFIVGHEKTIQLKELQDLNLGGVFRIEHLERAQSPGDSNTDILSNKPKLCELILQWEVNDNDAYNNSGGEDVDEQVLEALKPHPNLKKLKVNGFKGCNFPVWMGNSSTLQNIVQIEIHYCRNCSSLPQGMGELPHLESLNLTNLPLVEYIIENDDAGGQGNAVDQTPKFPRLELLRVEKLENLKGMLKKADAGEEEMIIFPNLQRLDISNCLEFVDSIEDQIKYLQNTIKNFELCDLPEMTYLPEYLQRFTSLEHLCLINLPLLTCLPDWLGNLTCLQKLIIFNCPNISSLPDAIMTNLKTLSIGSCPELVRRCEKEIGEDWHKIAHIHGLTLY